MSPVSRGRKPKKAKKSRKGKKPPVRAISSGWAKAARRESGGLGSGLPRSPLEQLFWTLDDEHTRWWQPSHERLIAASGSLLTAPGPRALEQATAGLIGAELYDAVRDERSGPALIERAVSAASAGA